MLEISIEYNDTLYTFSDLTQLKMFFNRLLHPQSIKIANARLRIIDFTENGTLQLDDIEYTE